MSLSFNLKKVLKIKIKNLLTITPFSHTKDTNVFKFCLAIQIIMEGPNNIKVVVDNKKFNNFKFLPFYVLFIF